MDTKHFKARLNFGQGDEEGRVLAAVSIFNMIDGDGDVVLPSFFTDGQPVKMAAWGHNWGHLAPGKGVIHVEPECAIFDGEFFLDTTHGLEHYRTVKRLGDLQEWSFGFKVLEAEPGELEGKRVRFLTRGQIYEVSPVLIGANRETETLAIKAGQSDDGTPTPDQKQAPAGSFEAL